MIKCPVSGVDMRHEEIHGVQVDVSDNGIWFDKGELLRLTEEKRHSEPSFKWADFFRRAQRPPEHHDRVLSCPHCGEDMEVEKLHKVTIDWCREHGVWLDDGELEAMLSNLRLDPLFLGKVATRLWEARY